MVTSQCWVPPEGGQAGGPGTGLGGGRGAPVQHSRCERPDVHVQKADQQQHREGQKGDGGPDAPVGSGSVRQGRWVGGTTHLPHRHL